MGLRSHLRDQQSPASVPIVLAVAIFGSHRNVWLLISAFGFFESARDGGWIRRLVCSHADHVARRLRSAGHHDRVWLQVFGDVGRCRQAGLRQFPRPPEGRLVLQMGACHQRRPRCGCGSRRRDQD